MKWGLCKQIKFTFGSDALCATKLFPGKNLYLNFICFLLVTSVIVSAGREGGQQASEMQQSNHDRECPTCTRVAGVTPCQPEQTFFSSSKLAEG